MILPESDFVLLKKKCLESPLRVYGFIVYTRAHSYIAKVLRDEDYWNELDEISGPDWPIFATRPLEEGFYSFPQTCNSTSNFSVSMNEIWHEPNENKKVLEWFSIKNSEDLPCMVIFAWNDNDKLERFIWKLSNESENKAFNSIREVVRNVTQATHYILPEYKKSVSVYRNVRETLDAQLFRRGFINSARSIAKFKELINMLL